MLSCKETTRLASDRLERVLGLREWIAYRMHILMCPFCRRFHRHLGWMRQMLRRCARLDDQQLKQIGELDDRAKERLRRAIESPPPGR